MSSCELDPEGLAIHWRNDATTSSSALRQCKEGHCITCSDEALSASVLRVDSENGLALVTIEGSETAEEIDITLVDDIAPGDVVLVHGGVAIAHIE